MGFGGPVWHASVSSPLLTVGSEVLEAMAREILDGFGDAGLGEWTEDRPKAFHIRRRLTPREQERVGDAVDIRGSAEEKSRMAILLYDLPEPLRSMVADSFDS
jgi:hypothetical protein